MPAIDGPFDNVPITKSSTTPKTTLNYEIRSSLLYKPSGSTPKIGNIVITYDNPNGWTMLHSIPSTARMNWADWDASFTCVYYPEENMLGKFECVSVNDAFAGMLLRSKGELVLPTIREVSRRDECGNDFLYVDVELKGTGKGREKIGFTAKKVVV